MNRRAWVPVEPTSSLAVRALHRESVLLVVGADHPLATPVTDAADEFARTTVFLTERGCGYRALLEAHLDRAGIQPAHTLEFDSVEAIRRCVEAGLGVALIPSSWLTEPLQSGALVAMDWFAPLRDRHPARLASRTMAQSRPARPHRRERELHRTPS
jgi:DNA-binding transcriptional LysR family regulator